MGDLSKLTQLIEGGIMREFAKAFSDTALQAEQNIKQSHNWLNDTGSLAASITGYLHDPHHYSDGSNTDPHKNFQNAAWLKARRGEIQSRYLAAYPQNTPEHYEPHTEEKEVGGELAAIVTAFVEYGDDVEYSVRVGGTFTDAAIEMGDLLIDNLEKIKL